MAAKNNEIFEEWQTMKITQDFLEVEGNQNANEKTESYLALIGNGHFSSQWRKIPEYLQIWNWKICQWLISVRVPKQISSVGMEKDNNWKLFYGQRVEHIFFQVFFSFINKVDFSCQ